jgi:hypothetical protein
MLYPPLSPTPAFGGVTLKLADLTPAPVGSTPLEIATLLVAPVAEIVPEMPAMLTPSTMAASAVVLLAIRSAEESRVWVEVLQIIRSDPTQSVETPIDLGPRIPDDANPGHR